MDHTPKRITPTPEMLEIERQQRKNAEVPFELAVQTVEQFVAAGSPDDQVLSLIESATQYAARAKMLRVLGYKFTLPDVEGPETWDPDYARSLFAVIDTGWQLMRQEFSLSVIVDAFYALGSRPDPEDPHA